jgi:ABC-type branched-subunit amino acid transport system substrate-binding protein
MVNSEGGIYGRQLELLLLDSKTDAGANRTAVLDACDRAFALVGSMSAFDNGGAQAVDDCGPDGIPDISAITTTGDRIFNQDTYPAYPNRPDLFIVGSGDYMAKRFPSAIKNAARLYLNSATTRSNSNAKAEAYEKSAGFNFIYRAETGVVESNYTPYVQKMEDAGVEFVTMLSDYQSIARLAKAMRSQQYTPEVMEWDSVIYSQKFLDEAEGAAEGSWFYLNTAMFEESQKYPELQLYQAWLARVAPGVPPDYFGLYAWSAGRLFVDLAKKVGPQITRVKLFDALKAEHSWDGFGLHASHDIGRKRASSCTMFARIQSNQFVRAYPKSGYNCSSSLQPTSVR